MDTSTSTATATSAAFSPSTTGSHPPSPGIPSHLEMATPPPPQLAPETTHTTSHKNSEPTTADLLAKIVSLHADLTNSQYTQSYLQARLNTSQSLYREKYQEALQLHARLESWGAHLASHAENVAAEIQYWTKRSNALAHMVADRDGEIHRYRASEQQYQNMIRTERARLYAKKTEVKDLVGERDMLVKENRELREKVDGLEGQKAVWSFKPGEEGYSREHSD